MHQPEQQRVLTVTQAAARSGKSRWTILRRLASGELRGRLVGDRWLIDATSLTTTNGDADVSTS